MNKRNRANVSRGTIPAKIDSELANKLKTKADGKYSLETLAEVEESITDVANVIKPQTHITQNNRQVKLFHVKQKARRLFAAEESFMLYVGQSKTINR